MLNAIDVELPGELADAVGRANGDPGVHVIVLAGAGRAFCAGYDLAAYAQAAGTNAGVQEMPWDPMKDYAFMMGNTEKFMSLFRSHRPVIAKVHGHAVAGGSDIALCCDLVVMAEDARIGYMPARVWGCPTTAMWVYRLGPEKAKRMLFTGDTVTGRAAEQMGLVLKAVPAAELDAEVEALAARMASVPVNQLMMQKHKGWCRYKERNHCAAIDFCWRSAWEIPRIAIGKHMGSDIVPQSGRSRGPPDGSLNPVPKAGACAYRHTCCHWQFPNASHTRACRQAVVPSGGSVSGLMGAMEGDVIGQIVGGQMGGRSIEL